ncbi:cytidine/deoxycytidylate deaminase family protein [Streptomyces huasconensis]|uniref:hypothetical protein n=1 Tax=Streptomyces huasconensis TaxID=1854574 RepID=UPI0037020ACE
MPEQRCRRSGDCPSPWRGRRSGAGSRPVGAALLDGDGTVVACGRNRSEEATAPPGRLAGAAIAHAEIDVLAQLPPRHHRLFTTLEPCLLGSGALLLAHVGTVVYATADPLRLAPPRIAEAGP